MTPQLILLLTLGYFAILLLIARLTGKQADNADFFIGGKKSPWPLVAFGMIGTSLSGVTFISVPGAVGNLSEGNPNLQMSYMQVVFGYLVGYLIIATILMPLYYRLQLTSIYTYLRDRFGQSSYQTGSWFFILSRTIGASFRIFLVTGIFQKFVLEDMGVPYIVTISVTLVLIWIYTYQGGIRTIVYTDSLQTFFMLLAVVLTLIYIGQDLEVSLGQMPALIKSSDFGQMFFWDKDLASYFPKQFLSGAAIATVMTGLDQDMMQKNNSCPDISSAQKNMLMFSVILVFVNLLFVGLGGLLYLQAADLGVAVPGISGNEGTTDHLFPLMAIEYFPPFFSAVFVVGLIAAAFSSADSAITALTTSFCVDILALEEDDPDTKSKRIFVHVGFSLLILLICFAFNVFAGGDVLKNLFRAAGFTYGPLLGLYAFGLSNRRPVRDHLVPLICILSVCICLGLAGQSIIGPLFGLSESAIASWNAVIRQLLGNYQIGFEILIINGLITYLGLWAISKPNK
jgi:Na+/proline symporter